MLQFFCIWEETYIIHKSCAICCIISAVVFEFLITLSNLQVLYRGENMFQGIKYGWNIFVVESVQ